MVVFRESPTHYFPQWRSRRQFLCSRCIDPTLVGRKSYQRRINAYSVSSWVQCGDLSSFLSLTSFCLLIVGADDYCCIWSHQWRTLSVGPSGRRIGPLQRPLTDKTQHSQETDTDAAGGIRTHNPNSRTAADSHLRPRGMWQSSTESPTHHATVFTVWWQLVCVSSCESNMVVISQCYGPCRTADCKPLFSILWCHLNTINL